MMKKEFMIATLLAGTAMLAIWQNFGSGPEAPPAMPSPAAEASGPITPQKDKVNSGPAGLSASFPSAPSDAELIEASPMGIPDHGFSPEEAKKRVEARRIGQNVVEAMTTHDLDKVQELLLEARATGIPPIIENVEFYDLDMESINALRFPRGTTFRNVSFHNASGLIDAPGSRMVNVTLDLSGSLSLFAPDSRITNMTITGKPKESRRYSLQVGGILSLERSRIHNLLICDARTTVSFYDATLSAVRVEGSRLSMSDLRTASLMTPLKITFDLSSVIEKSQVWAEDLLKGRYLANLPMLQDPFSGHYELFTSRKLRANDLRDEMAVLKGLMQDDKRRDPLTRLGFEFSHERLTAQLQNYRGSLPHYSTHVAPAGLGGDTHIPARFDEERVELAWGFLADLRDLDRGNIYLSKEMEARREEIREVLSKSGLSDYLMERPVRVRTGRSGPRRHTSGPG